MISPHYVVNVPGGLLSRLCSPRQRWVGCVTRRHGAVVPRPWAGGGAVGSAAAEQAGRTPQFCMLCGETTPPW